MPTGFYQSVPWSEKPQESWPLDEDNPFANRRIFWFGMHEIRGGFIDGNYRHRPKGVLSVPLPQAGVTRTGGTDAVISQGFLRLNSSGKTTKFESPSGVDSLADVDHTTYIVRVRTRPFESQGSSINNFFGWDTLSLNGISFSLRSGNKLWMDASNLTEYPTVDLTDPEFKTLIYAMNPTNGQLYVDGVPVGASNTNNVLAASASFIMIGGNSDNRFCDCDIEFAGIFEGEFTAAEAKDFSANPNQMYLPRHQFVFMPAAGGGPTINTVTLSDTIAVTDTQSEMLRLRERLTLDNAAINDFLETQRLRDRLQSDSITATDAAQSIRERNRTLTDSAAVTDITLMLRERNRITADSITATDTSLVLRERNRILSDAIALLDAIDAIHIVPGEGVINNVTLSDAIVLTDFSIELRERSRLLSDTLSLLDAIGAERHRARIISDSIISIVDSFVSYRARMKLQINVLSVTDAIETYIDHRVLLTDVLSVADSLIALRQRFRLLTDDISVIDDIIAQFITEVLNPIITSGLETLNIDIGLERRHNLIDVEQLNIKIGIDRETG